MTTGDPGPQARDEAYWAKPVSELHVRHELPPEAVNLNVEGRRPAPLAGGFGRMWQKTYRVSLGAGLAPQDVVKVWKERFPSFWPKPNRNRFYKPMGAISPGDVALINLSAGGVKLSTGILVLYADEVSFTFMTPEGHMFNGMITFSSAIEDDVTVAQAQALIRAQDPLTELAMIFGGHRAEDYVWKHHLKTLAAHFGVDAKATAERVCVDRRRQWSQWRNITKNAGIRSLAHALSAPFRALAKPFTSRKRGVA